MAELSTAHHPRSSHVVTALFRSRSSGVNLHETRLTVALRTESTNRASMGFGGLDLTVPGRRGGHQGAEQGGGSLSYFVNGPIERFPVRGRWCGKPANLPYELQGRHPDFLVGRRRFEIKQSFDIPTHFAHLPSSDSDRPRSRCPMPSFPFCASDGRRLYWSQSYSHYRFFAS